MPPQRIGDNDASKTIGPRHAEVTGLPWLRPEARFLAFTVGSRGIMVSSLRAVRIRGYKYTYEVPAKFPCGLNQTCRDSG